MMKRARGALAPLILVSGLLPSGGVVAASSTNITIPITIINPQNTCKVGFEGGVSGNTYTFRNILLKGQTQTHPSFQAVVTCENNSVVKTALKLRPAGAFQSSGNKVGLHPGGNPSVKSGELWLTLADGSTAPMGNNAGTTSLTPFCEGTASDAVKNSCTLTPVTSILASAPGGPVSTTLTFEVDYP
ncbi:TPA: hypothetical protein H1V70_004611 [Salmonella enterica]|nr:hypothetical protein [Salmonella enterica]